VPNGGFGGYTGYGGRPEIHDQYIPQDLDVQLPAHEHHIFDMSRFIGELDQFGVTVSDVHVDGFLTILLFDRDETGKFGPFTFEINQPQFAACQTNLDFDVNNLYVAKDFTQDLGMRVPVPFLNLRDIIKNVQRQQFIVCRGRDHQMEGRVSKRIARGWQHMKDQVYVPSPASDFGAVRLSVDFVHDPQGKEIAQIITSLPGGRKISRMFRIQTPNLEEIYKGMKQQIAQENNGDPNERFLWHGTNASDDIIDGICSRGFDNRFWTGGAHVFGYGGYFATDVAKADSYSNSSPKLLFYCKVVCGNAEELHYGGQDDYSERKATEEGYHSVLGLDKGPGDEVIIFRYGQAVPIFMIEYQ